MSDQPTQDASIEANLAAAVAHLEDGPDDGTPDTPEEPVLDAAPEPKTEPAQPAEPAKDDDKPQDLPSAKLKAAQQRDAALRKREEAVKAQESRLERLARYEAAEKRWRENKDPDGFFEAGGTTWEAVARTKLGAKGEPAAKAAEAKPELPPEVQSMRQELDELKRENAQKDDFIRRNNLRAHLMAKGDEFAFLNARGLHDQVYDALGTMEFPEGTTIEEAISLAARHEEERLEKEEFRRMLTTGKGQKIMQELSKTAVPSPQANSGASPKTTTNSQAGDLPPPNGAKKPMTIDETLKHAEQFLV